ncbi:CBS domain-containing protein [Streptomyces antimicrobicus]|uniref:CBS domain-containing protein n=1 Tax=Streptomyces antimicrobicus TaxID=2883108 RepID=A0ABS8B582_9ACTN|nr:CBS domain-containing protein [Streptomyces antimicrobicus]MCB5179788.1 CBS domain-containing protein [Streptomyces antimicrobicus]
MSQKIREIMTERLVTTADQMPVAEAARRMRDEDIGDVLVVDDGHVKGVVTDRDLVVRVLAEGKEPETTTVGEVCSGDVVTVAPDDDVSKAVELMRSHALRRLPVTENDRLVGIVSLGDLAVERDEQSALADISRAQPNT